MNPTDKELERLGESMKELSIPEQLTHSVQLGIEKGKREKRRQRFKKSYRPLLAVAVFLLFVSFAVRISPAFADTVSHIPGLAPFVDYIRGDQSVEDAFSNHYGTPLNLSETKGNTTVTLKQMVADEHRMVIFYTIQSSVSDKKIELDTAPHLYNSHKKVIEGTVEYNFPESKKKEAIHYQELDVNFPENVTDDLTDTLVLKLKVHDQTYLFDLPIDLKKIQAAKKVYKLNQTVSIKNQKMTVNKVTLYPTGVAVDVSYDPTNAMQITDLEDLRLVDENGKSYASIKNGVSAFGIPEDGHQVLFLDSNYFTTPQSLHLKLTKVRAIDKKDKDVVVNLKTKKLIQAPADHLLTLQNAGEGRAVFELKRTKEDNPNRDYQIFDSNFTDASGKSFRIKTTEVSEKADNDPSTEQIELHLPKKSFKEPVTFHIIDYPTRLHGNVDIKIK
ncbi:DUF4179 domain-containing protein [Pullulanibacillus sp. KACC 23026]|uniref:DUF4179 domain-containing protein n=1 Tax=Pullulanibacillus sp. KACC 23026 TaxID=3028315 RepID=UPI0023B19126|nr:DUF4179 domain-containing protein [Pullulanibacillus sp. KACC 23026]WEG12009.1 DUF4179 domain-containing protein [Pullulanibacillus sp. KACC 23026]